ncbi:MAG: 16S rRNA (adenine(1518)-N(6)/adenine(1519)-N(6))-dimethyltransferase RsmA [Bacteroidota bacterium]
MKTAVNPKKHLGQHFLNDNEIAEKVALLFKNENLQCPVIEIGPGMGVLTTFLVDNYKKVIAVDIDGESVDYLHKTMIKPNLKVIKADFLDDRSVREILTEPSVIIGNYPYNISSQIVFKVLENIENVVAFGGMFQKEVAQRLAAKEGSKTYGILSVMLNTYYTTTYEFTVSEHVFIPPPKVKSGVIKCLRKEGFELPCSKKLYFEVIKTAFNQRRKTLRNALHKFNLPESHEFAKLRAEQLSVKNFIDLTIYIENLKQ